MIYMIQVHMIMKCHSHIFYLFFLWMTIYIYSTVIYDEKYIFIINIRETPLQGMNSHFFTTQVDAAAAPSLCRAASAVERTDGIV